MKVTIQKPVGILGEVWLIEVPVTNDLLKSKDPIGAIKAQMSSVLRIVDDRLGDLNQRLIDHNTMAQKLAPEGLLAVRQCVDLMYGRMVAPDGAPPAEVTPPDGKIEASLERALEAADEGGR